MEPIQTINFREISDNLKTRIFDDGNTNFLFNNIVSRFEYTGLPIRDIDILFLELYLLHRGGCAFWKLETGEYVITPCQRIGNIDAYGRGLDLNCTTLNGKNKVFKNFLDSPDVVYIQNNILGTRDILTEKDAQSLTEILKSIDCAIVNTRFTDLLGVSDENQKTMLEKALKESQDGVPSVVVTDGFLEDEGGIKRVELHDVKNTDVIQYLHRAYDDVIRRFWNRNGLEVCTSTKLAQQTADEVNSGHNARLVESLNMLKQRQRAIAEINSKFGFNATVDFSELWKRELIEKENTETGEISQESEKETEEETTDEI